MRLCIIDVHKPGHICGKGQLVMCVSKINNASFGLHVLRVHGQTVNKTQQTTITVKLNDAQFFKISMQVLNKRILYTLCI